MFQASRVSVQMYNCEQLIDDRSVSLERLLQKGFQGWQVHRLSMRLKYEAVVILA